MWAEDGSCPPEEASQWNPLCQHLDLRVPSLQHCEKLISVVSSTHLWDFVMAAQTDQDRGQHNLVTTSQFLIFIVLSYFPKAWTIVLSKAVSSNGTFFQVTTSLSGRVRDWVAKLHLIIFLTTPSANSVDSGCAGSRHWVRGVRGLLRGAGCVVLER